MSVYKSKRGESSVQFIETARQLEAHTSQADWTPNTAVSLWVSVSAPAEEWPQWSQPTGAQDAYNKGDRVVYKGSVYESSIDGNSWSPEAYPAGWTLVP